MSLNLFTDEELDDILCKKVGYHLTSWYLERLRKEINAAVEEKIKLVAVKQISDPYDTRSGIWWSLEDIEKLTALPPKTKLYAIQSTKE